MNGHKCGTCRFWQKPTGENVERGECVRFPPQLAETQRFYSASLWPSTLPHSWCGEYAPANPETVSEGAVTLARLVLLGDKAAAMALADRLKGGDED